MEEFYDWMKGIAVVFIILTAIGSLVPKNDYRKYITLFVNMIITLTILTPVFHFFQNEENMAGIIHGNELELQYQNLLKDESAGREVQSDYYRKAFQMELTEYLKEMLKDYGTVNDVQIETGEDGTIEELEVKLEDAHKEFEGSEYYQNGMTGEIKKCLANGLELDENIIKVELEES